MKTFYHCLIMWVPFGLLFTFAGVALEMLEGNKIRTTEYLGLHDLGLIYWFIIGSVVFIFYLISFFPLTFIVSKFIRSFLFKVVIFTFCGGVIGAFAFREIYTFHIVEEYDLNIISAVILYSIAGFLYALVENYLKRNIKFA